MLKSADWVPLQVCDLPLNPPSLGCSPHHMLGILYTSLFACWCAYYNKN